MRQRVIQDKWWFVAFNLLWTTFRWWRNDQTWSTTVWSVSPTIIITGKTSFCTDEKSLRPRSVLVLIKRAQRRPLVGFTFPDFPNRSWSLSYKLSQSMQIGRTRPLSSKGFFSFTRAMSSAKLPLNPKYLPPNLMLSTGDFWLYCSSKSQAR